MRGFPVMSVFPTILGDQKFPKYLKQLCSVVLMFSTGWSLFADFVKFVKVGLYNSPHT